MMARLLVLLAVLAGAAAKHMLNVAEHGVCAAVNRSRACQIDSDGDGVVDALDPEPFNAEVDGVPDFRSVKLPAFVAPLWPPTATKVPLYVAIVAIAWATALLSMRGARTADDVRHDTRAFEAVLNNLVHVAQQQEKDRKLGEQYDEKKVELEADAKKASQRTLRPWEDEYQDLMFQNGFAGKSKPSPMDPRACRHAMIDEIKNRPVDVLFTRDKIGQFAPDAATADKWHARLVEHYAAAHAVLMARTIAQLDTEREKTEKARPGGVPDTRQAKYASGATLKEFVRHADEIERDFFARRSSGAALFARRVLLHGGDKDATERATRPAPLATAEAAWPKALGGRDATVERFFDTKAACEAYLADIRKAQKSRFLMLVGNVQWSTRAYFVVQVCGELAAGVFPPTQDFYSAKIAVDALSDGWRDAIADDLLALVVLFVLQRFCKDVVVGVSRSKLMQDFNLTLRTQVFESIMRQDQVYFDINGADYARRQLDICGHVAHTFLLKPAEILHCLSNIFTRGVYVYILCPTFLWINLFFGLGGGYTLYTMLHIVYIGDHCLRREGDRLREAQDRKTSQLLHQITTVREFAREEQEQSDYDRRERVKTSSEMKQQMVEFLGHPVFHTFMQMGAWISYFVGARLVSLGELTTTTYVQLANSMWGFVGYVNHIMFQLPQILEIIVHVERVFEILESASLIEPMPDAPPKPAFAKEDGTPFSGIEIEFQSVTFAYPTMVEKKILRGLSLKIPAGKTVAFVGERGCGKSTTIELIKRAYDPEPGDGVVLVNGRPLPEWDVRDYRRQIATVSQEITMFEGTIRENLLYGLSLPEREAFEADGPAETARKLRIVCDIAVAWDYIEAFPLQFETHLGKGAGAVTLSGGQQQGVAITRALLKNPKLLILDEATSALDAITQKKVADNISTMQMERGITVIQVAHRLDTLKTSDIIYFLNYGRVVETGGLKSLNRSAFEELLKNRVEHHNVFVFDKDESKLSGSMKKQVKSGFFKAMWNHHNKMEEFEEMDIASLEKKIKDMKEKQEKLQDVRSTVAHQTEVKKHVSLAVTKMKAVTHFIDSQRLHDPKVLRMESFLDAHGM